MLNTVLGPKHFPIDVIGIALGHTTQRFSGDAITLAQGADLPGLTYTSRRAVLVVSREGFILWSRVSEAAAKAGAVLRTAGNPIDRRGQLGTA